MTRASQSKSMGVSFLQGTSLGWMQRAAKGNQPFVWSPLYVKPIWSHASKDLVFGLNCLQSGSSIVCFHCTVSSKLGLNNSFLGPFLLFQVVLPESSKTQTRKCTGHPTPGPYLIPNQHAIQALDSLVCGMREQILVVITWLAIKKCRTRKHGLLQAHASNNVRVTITSYN